jgi:uncharacterized DUF497 family protein
VAGKFEWDEAKSERNRTERGFDFEFAKRVFDGDTLERVDNRWDYGEERIVAFGKIEGEVLAVVYTWRGSVRRIISARRASRREHEAYFKSFT